MMPLCELALVGAVWIGGSLSFILASEILDTIKHRRRMRILDAEIAAIKLSTRKGKTMAKSNPKLNKPRKPAADQAAPECPLQPVIKRLNQLYRVAEMTDLENQNCYLVHDQIEALKDYSVTVRAASFEGALFQLGLIFDLAEDIEGIPENHLQKTERDVRFLIFSIASFLRQFAGTLAEDPAIDMHLCRRLDPMAMIEDKLASVSA
jgi:hypothetical protein